MPKEENAQGGTMQLMLYKEMFDGMVRAGFEDLKSMERSKDEESDGAVEMIQTTLPGSSTPVTKPKISQPLPLDPFSFQALFDHLQLDADAPFSEVFMDDSHVIVTGNDLQCGAKQARTLHDMRMVWARYCERLGIGEPSASLKNKDDNAGRSEKQLALVYRHTEKTKKRGRQQPSKSSSTAGRARPPNGRRFAHKEQPLDEETAIALAIAASLEDERMPCEEVKMHPASQQPSSAEGGQQQQVQAQPTEHDLSMRTDQPRPGESQLSQTIVELQDDNDEPPALSLFPPEIQPTQVAFAVTDAPVTSIHNDTTLRIDDETNATMLEPPTPTNATRQDSITPSSPTNTGSQPPLFDPIPQQDHRIIGSHTFNHSARLLAARLDISLGFWMGKRSPVGVEETDISRCGWCEFEEGCEWR